MRQKLDSTLVRLDSFLKHDIYENHPNINSGGCCVFAGALGPYLAKLGKVRVRVQGGWDTEASNIDDVRPKVKHNTVRQWNEQGIHFSHVFLELKYNGSSYFVDAKGVKSMWGTYCLEGALTIEEAAALAARPKGWNSWFNRREIPTIKRRLKTFFDAHLKRSKRAYMLAA